MGMDWYVHQIYHLPLSSFTRTEILMHMPWQCATDQLLNNSTTISCTAWKKLQWVTGRRGSKQRRDGRNLGKQKWVGKARIYMLTNEICFLSSTCKPIFQLYDLQNIKLQFWCSEGIMRVSFQKYLRVSYWGRGWNCVYLIPRQFFPQAYNMYIK